jgi:sugar phosphate isomerase/epimerase
VKIGAQAYTFRKEMAADPAAALARLRAAGYELVELAGLHERPPRVIADALASAGVRAVAAHVPWQRLTPDAGGAVEELAVLGVVDAVVPSMPRELREAGPDAYVRFGHELAALAGRLAEHGLRLHYHNHAFEIPAQGGRSGLEALAEAAGPEVGLELDLGWIRAGGGDPGQWVERAGPGRVRLVHLKDFRFEDGAAVQTAVGDGEIDWGTVLRACEAARVEWYIVEEDDPPGDPFERLAASLRNVSRI